MRFASIHPAIVRHIGIEMDTKTPMIDLAAQIVAAYVARNAVEQSDLPRLIADVHRALEHAASGVSGKDELIEPKPAVNIKKSITPDYLICLEDGKKSQMN